MFRPRCAGGVRVLLVGSVLGVLLAPAVPRAQTAGGYGDVIDWMGWGRRSLPGESAGLASSSAALGQDPDANRYEWPPGVILHDADTIAATIRGPGILYRFWMPHRAAAQPFALRMYFDGESTPRIDTDSGQLLGGTYARFTDPLVTTCAGGQVSYVPIAFRDSIRIETENIADAWHWYQYSYRRFPPGTDIASYEETPDPETLAAHAAMADLFAGTGAHPGGESATATQSTLGASVVPAGGALVLADLAGPGVLRRVTMRLPAATDAELDSLHLRVLYDGDATPAIDAPVSWFFGAGHDRAPYRSLPMGTDSPDGFYCYWPMPYRAAVRVELRNVSAAPISVDATRVENEPGPVPDDACYLHAVTHAEVVVNGQTRNVMAQVQGAGHYVGNLLFVDQDHDTHYFLEADDLVFVDGALATNGTGLEDAYNGGFYYNWVPDPMDEPEGPSPPSAIRPLHGILRVERTASPPYGRADQYRWLIGDRVPFSQSLEVQVETSYSWAGSRWNSVVFWYQVPASATGVPDRRDDAPRSGLELDPPSPNPAAAETVFRFTMPRSGRARLAVYDVRGRLVATLRDGPCAAGTHEVRWTPRAPASGVFACRLETLGEVRTRKVVLTGNTTGVR
jgi:Protein of unknown function (DUF2961)